MQRFNVSENIGFDGHSYYCRRCGKAGYARVAQARGHLSLCPGTMMRKGIPIGGTQKYSQVPTSGLNGGLGDSQVPPEVLAANPVDSQLAARCDKLEGQVAQLQNEYHHVLGERNRPSNTSSWLSQNMGLVIVGVLVLFVVLSANRGGCQDGTSQRGGPDLSKLADRVLGKAADTFVSKGLGRVFR